ncbi:DNA helicase [Balamuthia mandrillaris]
MKRKGSRTLGEMQHTGSPPGQTKHLESSSISTNGRRGVGVRGKRGGSLKALKDKEKGKEKNADERGRETSRLRQEEEEKAKLGEEEDEEVEDVDDDDDDEEDTNKRAKKWETPKPQRFNDVSICSIEVMGCNEFVESCQDTESAFQRLNVIFNLLDDTLACFPSLQKVSMGGGKYLVVGGLSRAILHPQSADGREGENEDEPMNNPLLSLRSAPFVGQLNSYSETNLTLRVRRAKMKAKRLKEERMRKDEKALLFHPEAIATSDSAASDRGRAATYPAFFQPYSEWRKSAPLPSFPEEDPKDSFGQLILPSSTLYSLIEEDEEYSSIGDKGRALSSSASQAAFEAAISSPIEPWMSNTSTSTATKKITSSFSSSKLAFGKKASFSSSPKEIRMHRTDSAARRIREEEEKLGQLQRLKKAAEKKRRAERRRLQLLAASPPKARPPQQRILTRRRSRSNESPSDNLKNSREPLGEQQAEFEQQSRQQAKEMMASFALTLKGRLKSVMTAFAMQMKRESSEQTTFSLSTSGSHLVSQRRKPCSLSNAASPESSPFPFPSSSSPSCSSGTKRIVFGLRLGIHSGSVIVGTLGPTRLLPRTSVEVYGDAVRRVDCLRESCGVGRILVSEEVRDCLSRKFRFASCSSSPSPSPSPEQSPSSPLPLSTPPAQKSSMATSGSWYLEGFQRRGKRTSANKV